MYWTKQEKANQPRWKRGLRGALQLLGSLKLAVVLLGTLAAVIATATILEANHGRLYAQWYVYHSGWFIALLALLGVNILCAALARFPWKRHQTGFVVTHAGLLILLGGAIYSFVGGIEGQVSLREGETTTRMIMPQQCQVTATWVNRPEEPPYEFAFEPGPSDWREGKTLHIGEIDGISARVLRYYNHATAVEEWVPDRTELGGPVVKLKVEGPHGTDSMEQTLADQDYGDEVFIGPIRTQLQRAISEVMIKDFLTPPTDKLGEKGLLLAYYKDQVARIIIHESLGKTIPIGDTGAAVQIVRFMPNARPDAHGRFESMGDHPRNPVVEMRLTIPGQKDPVRQMAFAKSPLLNLDPVYERVCPVKCCYLHPAIKPPNAVDFMQGSDDALYWRIFADGRLVSSEKAKPGSTIQLAGKFQLTVADHLPHARARIVFQPVEVDPNQNEKPEAAAEVAITVGGTTQTVWLQRNHPSLGTRAVVTSEGQLQVRLGYGEAPLGYALRLVAFNREKNPGGIGNASYASVVRVIDEGSGIDDEYDISMNKPLTYKKLTLYQSGFNEGGPGQQASTFSVAHDPGRPLKYGGSLMICLGIAIMFYMRAYFFKNVAQHSSWFTFRRNKALVPATPASVSATPVEATSAPQTPLEPLVSATRNTPDKEAPCAPIS